MKQKRDLTIKGLQLGGNNTCKSVKVKGKAVGDTEIVVEPVSPDSNLQANPEAQTPGIA